MRTTFLVGRVNRKGAEMVVLKGGKAPPFPGPWTLKALVRPRWTLPEARPAS
jgi:hypothetical protein